MVGGVPPCAEAARCRPWRALHRTAAHRARFRSPRRQRGVPPARAVQLPRLPASAPSAHAPAKAPHVCPCGLISGCLSRSALPEQTAVPATPMRLVAAPVRGNCSACHSRAKFTGCEGNIMRLYLSIPHASTKSVVTQARRADAKTPTRRSMAEHAGGHDGSSALATIARSLGRG